MSIEASIILDSVSPAGKRLTTFLLRYPRFIHAEFMTHRAFSRNASSSRAIPVEKMIDQVVRDAAWPEHWGANQAGMQAREEVSPTRKVIAQYTWLQLRNLAVEHVQTLLKLGLHKQVANRLLEPWMHITVLCTATEYGNFFNLRHHPDAQPEIRVLAEKMWGAYSTSKPTELKPGEWHLPFIRAEERELPLYIQIRCSAARAARTSYNNHDGSNPVIEKDLALYERLVGADPKHASPTEHQATPSNYADVRSGNFVGWYQYRQSIHNESLPIFTGPRT